MIHSIFNRIIKTDENARAADELFREIARHKRAIMLGATSILFGALLSLPLPFIMKRIIDVAIPRKDMHALLVLIAVMVLLHVGKSLQSYYSTITFFVINNRIIMNIRNILFSHLNKTQSLILKTHNTGYLMSRIEEDPRNLQGIFGQKVVNLVKDFVLLVVSFGALFYLNWILTILVFGILMAIVAVVVIYGKRIKAKSEITMERVALTTRSLEENINMIETIKLFNHDRYNIKRYMGELFDTFRELLGLERLQCENNIIIGLIAALIPVAVLGYGGYSIVHSAMTIGGLMAYMMFLVEVIQPAASLFGFNIELQTIRVALMRIQGILDLPVEKVASLDVGRIRSLELNAISFSYGDQSILKQISITAHIGDMIGIIGDSGAGKTTLMNIIAGLYHFDGCAVINEDVKCFGSLEGIRSQVAVVNQEPFFFNETIASNITLSSRNHNIQDVLDRSCSSDFVNAMEGSEKTLAGEKGNRLSVGQKQRLAIARALYKDTDVIVFDEPTASVDPEVSSKIVDVINALVGQKIVFVIAHKYESMKACNKIYIIRNGQLELIGDFNALMAYMTPAAM